MCTSVCPRVCLPSTHAVPFLLFLFPHTHTILSQHTHTYTLTYTHTHLPPQTFPNTHTLSFSTHTLLTYINSLFFPHTLRSLSPSLNPPSLTHTLSPNKQTHTKQQGVATDLGREVWGYAANPTDVSAVAAVVSQGKKAVVPTNR